MNPVLADDPGIPGKSAKSQRWWAAHALLPTGLAHDVLVEVEGGRFTAITPGSDPAGAARLPGVALPGFANAHSHAFHRALRGRTHDRGGTFWTWREAMYSVAAKLDPDSYLDLARATYAEMALAGVTTVGEFHYLHHAPDGTRYDDSNAMAAALTQAAADAGIRLTVLDACYLAGGLAADGHLPLDPVQERFSDGTVFAWADRVSELRDGERVRIGHAIHSVRAVPSNDLAPIVDPARPLHVHVSEQPAENEASEAFYGCSPTELLTDAGALGPMTTAVHATHVSAFDIALLGSSRSTVCFCPSTERDLADGIGPARELVDAGAGLSLGSDQNAVVDLLGEAHALEDDERLRTLHRGRFTPAELLLAVTAHDSLGWPDAGALVVGGRADLVCVRDDTIRTAGADRAQLVLVASAADVDTVWVDGTAIVEGGRHRLGDVGRLLSDAITPLWKDA